jgi:hypothetical protein
VGLFLIALMDRWVSLVMQGRYPQVTMYTDFRARYGLCLCILYFCMSVMALDATLQRFWGERFIYPGEKLNDFEHAKRVSVDWLSRRRRTYRRGLSRVVLQMMAICGLTTMILWLTVQNHETLILYGGYVLGYSCVVVFQFNRCFAKDVGAHTIIIYLSAFFGLVVGCTLHALPCTAGLIYSDVIALNAAAITAALLTSTRAWTGLRPSICQTTDGYQQQPKLSTSTSALDGKLFKQRLISATNHGTLSRGDTLLTPSIKWKMMMPKKKRISAPSPLHTAITAILLQVSIPRHPIRLGEGNDSKSEYLDDMVQTASRMWTCRLITVSFVEKTRFGSCGFADSCSVGKFDEQGHLEIVIGALGRDEIGKDSWTAAAARMYVCLGIYSIFGHCKANLCFARQSS